MIIIIPLGGLGTRFRQAGYNNPKPLVNAMGKPIIYWLLDCLQLDNINQIIIPYNNELTKYRFEDKLRKDYPSINFNFVNLVSDTRGAIETILFALNKIDSEDQPVLCLDGDNFYTTDIIGDWSGDNCVFTFYDNSPEEIFSYIKEENGKITDIAEKRKISDLASCGGYGFESWKTLKSYCQKVIKNNIRQKGEFYTSVVINEMLKDKHVFIAKKVSKDDYICLGTPLHLRLFSRNSDRFITNKPKRYCFDLDNTLVTYPKVHGDYSTVEPIKKNIKFVRNLKSKGHTIIIYTARRMKTHNGNTGKLLADIGRLTFETLDNFDIPYDEIYFGKPYADVYIDDLGLSVFNDLEKELGFYETDIIPRDFNTVTSSSVQVYRKKSDDLSGEIYYYNNIPTEFKYLFPTMFKWDPDYKWYDIERINGIPLSKLFISGDLTIKHLDTVINSFNQIHQNSTDVNSNIYSNYASKLKQRFNHDLYPFSGVHIMYAELYEQLKKYEKSNTGIVGIIHGDPVLTNILLDTYGQIKFIDMRGKLGDECTIYGDVMYDWAKLYQSLIGYDEILEDMTVNSQYKKKLIEHFLSKFPYDVNNLKLITKSLLFTLIPLHDFDKREKFYDLIKLI